MPSHFSPMGSATACCPRSRPRPLRGGRFHWVPVLSGSTRDEHRLFVGLFRVLAGQPVTAQLYPTLLADAFGEHAGQVQARYPLDAFSSPSQAWATVLTDRMWARSTFQQHRLLAEQVPTYAYEFADRQAPMYLPFPEDFPPGAFHAAEVPYLFRDQQFQAGSTHDQRCLSDQMIRYWANFALRGDPNGAERFHLRRRPPPIPRERGQPGEDAACRQVHQRKSTLDDRPVEQARRPGGDQVGAGGQPAVGLAEHRHVAGITTERGGVAPHPPQRRLLVLQAEGR